MDYRSHHSIAIISLFITLVVLLPVADIFAQTPTIKVQHPRKNAVLPYVDSTFIHGMVTPGFELEINGVKVEVHEEGGFLVFLDVSPGDFTFKLVAKKGSETTSLEWPIRIAERNRWVPFDSLAILTEFAQPSVYQQLIPGDLFEVSFRGTPNAMATFRIDGVTDDIPMMEDSISFGGSWGDEVFGAGATEKTEVVRGIYTGGIYIPQIDSTSIDSARIVLTLRVPHDRIPEEYFPEKAYEDVIGDTILFVVEDTLESTVSIVDFESPVIVEMKDSVQTIRTGPRKGYLSIFQPKGVRFVCDGKYDNYLRLRLAPGQTAWVPDTAVVFLPLGTPVPSSHVRTIRSIETDSIKRVEIILDEKLPFRIEHYPRDRKFVISVYGATSDTDWIKYMGKREFVERIAWRQQRDGIYEVTVEYENGGIWGWDGYYAGNVLALDIKPAPGSFRSYHDLRVLIDPGHSSDPGAIGPTGYTEAEANLGIADKLAAVLRKKGATVFMTRIDDADVKLYERPMIAVEKDCDVFISVHNNSVPVSVNPNTYNGVSTYYYNPHSKILADYIQTEFLDKLPLGDHGLYYANFAVTRPTQYLAVLVECAFMILPEQEARLKKDDFQMKCAKAIADGLDEYLNSIGH